MKISRTVRELHALNRSRERENLIYTGTRFANTDRPDHWFRVRGSEFRVITLNPEL